MKKKVKVAALSLGLGIAGFGGWFALEEFASRRAPMVLEKAFDWPEGQVYRYAVDWTSKTHVVIDTKASEEGAKPQALDGTIDFGGDLVLRSHGRRAGASYLLGVSIARIERCSLVLLGHDVLADGAAASTFDGREAIVEIDAGGTIQSLHFQPGDPPLFKHLMQALLAEISLHVEPGTAEWEAREENALGASEARYRVVSARPPKLERTRTAYASARALPGRTLSPADESLKSHTAIALDPAGHLASLEIDEALTALRPKSRDPELRASTHLALSLRDMRAERLEQADRLTLASREARRPAEVVASADLDRRLLEKHTEGITRERLRTELLSFAVSGAVSDPRGWLTRARALLALHPEYCDDMVVLFEAPVMNDRGRAQILDLLAGTDTPESQTAMRSALDGPAAKGEARRALVERLAIVGHPTLETLEYVERELAGAASTKDRISAAYVLGAAASNARGGEAAVAIGRINQELWNALSAARSPEERGHLIAAIGNVGAAENLGRFLELGRDSDASVRSSAVWALRKLDAPEARAAMTALVADPAPEVARNAIRALGYQRLRPEDLAALSETVTTGGTDHGTDDALLMLLAAHQDGGAPVAEMARYLLGRNSENGRVRAEIRHLLRAMK